MTRLTKKSSLRLLLCFVVLGWLTSAHADDQPTNGGAYRSEIRSRLAQLQLSLDLMLSNHQLTTDQYQAESARVKSLRLQTRVDAQQHDSMTESDRDTDFTLIRLINQEATQLAAGNAVNAPTSQNPLSSLQVQYTNLNSQYQTVDNQYGNAISAKDLPTAQALRTQLIALQQQSDDLRGKMQDQLAAPVNP